MKNDQFHRPIDALVQPRLGRRKFLSQAGILGVGAVAGFSFASAKSARAQDDSNLQRLEEAAQSKDTVQEIFTAALIAEDLASTFYYNGLVGPVIQDPNLAGPGGSATDVTTGDQGNVNYIQAALSEEIAHADLFRSLLGISDPANDPVQTFYFPAGSFDTLPKFTRLLNTLENIFIAAYLTAVQEFALMAANSTQSGQSSQYTAVQLEYFAKVAASIMGIECEHRVLGRDLSNTNPVNNLAYEQTDGLNAVFNGPHSAVVALSPYLSPSTGPSYSLATALANQSKVSLPVTGAPPAY